MDALKELLRGDLTIEQVERIQIESTLEACNGNKTHAARKLGISIRTIRNKVHEYGLTRFINGPMRSIREEVLQ